MLPGLPRARTLTVDSPTEFSIQGHSLRQAIANHNARGSARLNTTLARRIGHNNRSTKWMDEMKPRLTDLVKERE